MQNKFSDMDARAVIKLLGLKPLPGEGGFYRETYRSEEKILSRGLPERYGVDKHFSTAIYFLLTPDCFSAIHRITSDEVFHFYLGDPVIMLMLHENGKSENVILGRDIKDGQLVQHVVNAGVWQGSCLVDGGKWALLGTTVAPAFDFSDFELGKRQELIRKYPDQKQLVEKLALG